MGRHDVGIFLMWATGTSLVATAPRVVELPHVLAAILPWVTGVGVILTTGLGALIGVAKALKQVFKETTQLVDTWMMLERAWAKFRRTRRIRKTQGSQQPGRAAFPSPSQPDQPQRVERCKRDQFGAVPPPSSLAARRRPDAPEHLAKAA
jgi:hypothetical protein